MNKYVGYKINEMLLLGVILIQIGDFFKLLDPFWDYVNKIINWVIIAVLIYMISPSDVFFGEKHGWWDLSVIVSFFCLVLKNFLVYATTARDEMLRSITSSVALIPTAAAKGVNLTTITVENATYLTFSFFHQMEKTAEYILPYATQLTMGNGRIPVAVTNGVETTTAVIQPYGLNGMILQLYNTLLLHQAAIERIGFLLGAVALLCLGLYAAVRFKVEEKSLLGVLHDGGDLKGAVHITLRIVVVLFVLAAFFVILFNPVVEWLAMAVDAAFAMLGVTVILYLLLRSRRRGEEEEEESVVDRIGGFGNSFFERFGKLFEEKRTIFLALSGLLILHLLVDLGSFVLPYVTGLTDPLYFNQLGAEQHRTFWTLLSTGWSSSLPENLAHILLYLLNIVGIVGLLTMPAYFWYRAYRRVVEPNERLYELSGWGIALLLTGAAVLFFAPAMKLATVTSTTLVGVDLQTLQIAATNPVLVAEIALLLFGILTIAMKNQRFRDFSATTLLLGTMTFLGYYTWLFLVAIITYYATETMTLFSTFAASSFSIGLCLSLFFLIELLFYTIGFFGFIYEMYRE